MTRILIVGSREFNDYPLVLETVLDYLNSKDKHTSEVEIVSGGARGADAMGKRVAKALGIRYREFPAAWDEFGKAAGYIRNAEMADYLDEQNYSTAFVFWDGESKGTQGMLDKLLLRKINTQITFFEK
jgi:hypothetical protein